MFDFVKGNRFTKKKNTLKQELEISKRPYDVLIEYFLPLESLHADLVVILKWC